MQKRNEWNEACNYGEACSFGSAVRLSQRRAKWRRLAEDVLLIVLSSFLTWAGLEAWKLLKPAAPGPAVRPAAIAPERAAPIAPVPAAPSIGYNLTVAWTLWGEARGEPPAGKRLVAATIYRDAGGRPDRYSEACRKRFRFSCWNDYLGAPEARPELHNDQDAEAWRQCVALATAMQRGTFTAPAYPAAYHRNDGRRRPWIPKVWKSSVVGNHRFYTDWRSP
jgi:hypothetical protein